MYGCTGTRILFFWWERERPTVANEWIRALQWMMDGVDWGRSKVPGPARAPHVSWGEHETCKSLGARPTVRSVGLGPTTVIISRQISPPTRARSVGALTFRRVWYSGARGGEERRGKIVWKPLNHRVFGNCTQKETFLCFIEIPLNINFWKLSFSNSFYSNILLSLMVLLAFH